MIEPAMQKWADLVSLGTANAMAGLSQMIGQEIEVRDFELERVPVASISEYVGGAEAQSVGIYLTVTGAADGHLMLIYEPRVAFAFVDLLMMQPPDTTTEMSPMATSALGEMGNVIGAFFLNAIADATGLSLRPSPPTVMTDMAGALLDVVTADILLYSDDTYLADTTFATADRDITGAFFVIPSQGLLEAILSPGIASAA
ncbi:MAG: chemotaxis protein CheC [Dehalococcoidia bacterium]